MVKRIAVSSRGSNGRSMLIFFFLLLISFLSVHESQKRKMERVCKEIEKRRRQKTVTSVLESVLECCIFPILSNLTQCFE